MKKIIFTTLLLLCSLLPSMAARGNKARLAYPGGHFQIYRVYLTDKQGTTGSLSHLEQFLSQRALERRQRQHLTVDSTDLPVSARYLSEMKAHSFEVVGSSKWNNTVLVRIPQEKAQTIDQLRTLPFVKSACLVFTAPDSCANVRPDTVFHGKQTLLYPVSDRYGDAEHQILMLNGKKLHEAGFRGQGKLIAIIDGGFMNANQIPLFDNIRILGHHDCAYPYDADVFKLLDHGTMVLSTMAMNRDSLFTGTAPDASFFLLRSEDGRTEFPVEEDYWAQAAEYADSIGADVVNSSLGYTRFDDRDLDHTYREQDGKTALISRTASLMASKGMILVNSAGNEGDSSWKRINVPGDASDILTVAALKADSVNAGFSSVGPSFDGRVKPDVSAMGYHSTVVRGNGRITTANGTSFSSPILCGMVASLWSALPNLTAYQIMDLVRRSADRYDFPDNIYGYGIPNFWEAYQMGLTVK